MIDLESYVGSGQRYKDVTENQKKAAELDAPS